MPSDVRPRPVPLLPSRICIDRSRQFASFDRKVGGVHTISVPELDTAIAWFDANQVVYVKRPEQGKMKDVAFIKDPDGYWIEIVEPGRLQQLGR